jgi:hypothetical protein
MNPEYRRQLLAIMARIEQNITEAEALTVEPADDVVLQRATRQLQENREMLRDVEEKLRSAKS